MAGFTYKIRNKINGREYIGKKYFYSEKKIKSGRRTIIEKTQSDWLTYYGSSKDLTADINKFGHQNFERIMLACYRTRAEVDFEEVKLLFHYDVLRVKDTDGSWHYYNRSILGRYFRSTEEDIEIKEEDGYSDSPPEL